MIRQTKNTIFLILINCSLSGCFTEDIGINKNEDVPNKEVFSFNVTNHSSLLIKNTDTIMVFSPTFSCKSTTVLCPASQREFEQQQEKVKPYIEKNSKIKIIA